MLRRGDLETHVTHLQACLDPRPGWDHTEGCLCLPEWQPQPAHGLHQVRHLNQHSFLRVAPLPSDPRSFLRHRNDTTDGTGHPGVQDNHHELLALVHVYADTPYCQHF